MSKHKHWNIALLGSFVAFSLIWVAFVAPANAEDLSKGEKIYKFMCAKCHGKEGKGDGPKAEKLDKKPSDYTQPGYFDKRSDDELFTIIVDGNLPMPSFELKLSEEDIDNVLAYIKTFAAPATQ